MEKTYPVVDVDNLALFPKVTVAVGKHVFSLGSTGAFDDPQITQMLLKDKRIDDVMMLLKALTPEDMTHALSANELLWHLAIAGRAQEMISILKNLRPDQQGKILASGMGLEALLKKGYVGELLDMIQNCEPEDQTTILAKKYIISHYFAETNELAEKIYNIIFQLSSEQQTKVFSTHYVISSLSKHGFALDVFGLIATFDSNQKARVAIAKGYDEVKSYCSRRRAERQPSLHLVAKNKINLMSALPPAPVMQVIDGVGGNC